MLKSLFSDTVSQIELPSILLCTLVQTVMIMVNGNLGTSVAILGAFGLVRFRSIPGTSKEILSVFFAMAIGLATGMGEIYYAIIFTVILVIVLFLLHYLPLFNVDSQERLLKVVIPEDLDYTTVFQEIFQEYTKNVQLEQVKTINMGSLFELNYRITLAKTANEKEMLDAIRIKNGNLKVMLSHPLEGTEI